MSKKHDISDEEKALFRDAVRGVKPIVNAKIERQNKPIPRLKKRREAEHLPLAPLSDYEKADPVSSDDMIAYNQPGIPHKTLRKLRDGQYNVEAILDLHGMTVAEAKEVFYHFLLQCQRKGTRHILIIHGKGRSITKPILKNMLNNWLRQMEQVLAFCSAAAKDGRSGAMYVYLKQQKGENHFDE